MPDPREIFLHYIKQKNLKWSRQREIILQQFISTHKHVTTEELYQSVRKKYSDIGYATVHRTLKLLAECGLASEAHFSDRYTRFESKQEDGHHDHLICTQCGRIVEFECEKIEKMQESIARQKGFKVVHHKLELYGVCKQCRTSSKK
jgi:Fur family ferric uptake transcriptional regulator